MVIIFIKNYVERLKTEFSGYNPARLGQDVMSGVTVAAVALPLALAFGVSCGADAAAGLITAILAGIVISALSGASFQISGPTGAMTAVLITIVAKYQLQGVFVVSLLAGIMILLMGLFRLGKLVSLIPLPVVTGFTSGIAVIIALGQIDNLFGTTSQGDSALAKLASYGRLGFSLNWQALVIGLIVIAVMIAFPKKWNARVPSSLVGIIVATAVSVLAGFDVATVGEIPKTLLPANRLDLSAIDFSQLGNYLSPALTVALLAVIESLLCGASASRMKNESFDADQELIAQGVGNILIPFFGGVPATAAIARTSVAIKSGCRTRLTGIVHSLVLMASMFLLGPVMSKLPLSALAGVLMMTAWRMNEWHTIKYIFKNKFWMPIAQFVLTMGCTVVFDLTVAIAVGVVFSFLAFLVTATKLDIELSPVKPADGDAEPVNTDAVVMYITGAVFFANAAALRSAFERAAGYSRIIVSLRGVSSIDFGGAQAMLELFGQARENGKLVALCGARPGVLEVLKKTGVVETVGGALVFESLDRALISDAVPEVEYEADPAR